MAKPGPEFDRLWQEFTDLDMTITIHLGGRMVRFGEQKHFLSDLLMSKFAMGEPISIMIFNGVFQRFPKLRYVTVESGGRRAPERRRRATFRRCLWVTRPTSAAG